VYFNDQFYETDEANGGLILIPFTAIKAEQRNTSLVLVDNEFSDFVSSVDLPV
jgi:hypothetical protein